MGKTISLKKIGTIAGITILLIAVAVGLFYQFFMKGVPFEVASKYANSNRTIVDALGVIENLDLSLFSDLSYAGPAGDAHYKIFVTGEKGTGVLYIDMIKQAGEWKVVHANLFTSNNTKIPLE
jgi:hypothetical protein